MLSMAEIRPYARDNVIMIHQNRTIHCAEMKLLQVRSSAIITYFPSSITSNNQTTITYKEMDRSSRQDMRSQTALTISWIEQSSPRAVLLLNVDVDN